MSKVVDSLIRYHSEGHSLDYKEAQYPMGRHAKKHEFLKDISAMANHPSDEDKYIIIGVIEKNGLADGFKDIVALTDEANYQQYVKSNLEPEITFEYKTFNYDRKRLAYFRLYNNSNRPYLFKKNVQNAESGSIEFRQGDGYIRKGTATEKLVRSDFELIYFNRSQKVDRRKDLMVTAYSSNCNDEELSELRFIDIAVENISNHSIELEIEMKVEKGSDFKLVSQYDLKREMADVQKQWGSFPTPLFNISFSDLSTHVLMMTDKVKISQFSKLRDLFEQQLLIHSEASNEIKVEVTIRSDDFSEGLLNQSFLMKYENDEEV